MSELSPTLTEIAALIAANTFTAAEREQVRYKLGLDGIATAPSVTGTASPLPTNLTMDHRVSQILKLDMMPIFHFDAAHAACTINWLAGTPEPGWEVRIYATNFRYLDNGGVYDPQLDPTTVLLGTVTAAGLALNPGMDAESGVLYVEFPVVTPPFSPCTITITDLMATRVLTTDGVSGEQCWTMAGVPLKWATEGWLPMRDGISSVVAGMIAGGIATESAPGAIEAAAAGGGITTEQYAALAKEATVLGQFGVTYGITYPLVRRDGAITVTRGDVATIIATLGASWPLAGKTVYFCAQKKRLANNTTAIVNRAMTITDVATRACSITLTAAELATAGQYLYEIEVRDTGTDANPSTAEAGTLNIIDDLRK